MTIHFCALVLSNYPCDMDHESVANPKYKIYFPTLQTSIFQNSLKQSVALEQALQTSMANLHLHACEFWNKDAQSGIKHHCVAHDKACIIWHFLHIHNNEHAF